MRDLPLCLTEDAVLSVTELLPLMPKRVSADFQELPDKPGELVYPILRSLDESHLVGIEAE